MYDDLVEFLQESVTPFHAAATAESWLLAAGFTDTFRHFYPGLEGAYSWWSYRFHAREKNAGWRIDYFLVSPSLKEKLQDAKIHGEIMGSDHCPVELDIDL